MCHKAAESPRLATTHDAPRPAETAPRPQCLTVAVLRQKLDAAIVARERLVEAERVEAGASGKVVRLDDRRR
jgi:hypothetical protein